MSHTDTLSFDAQAMTPRQRKIAFTAIGGYFVDGFDLLVLSGALLAIIPAFGLGSGELGALTAAAFLGMAVGSAFAGPATDRFGRKIVFTVSMMIFVVASLTFLFVGEAWQVIVLRFIIGLAIGADMPAAGALLAEFIPSKRRGRYTSLAGVAWMLGSLAAIGVTLAIYAAFGTEAWRWVMATGAIAALVLIIMRHRTPESPMWLRSRGRIAEAKAAWLYTTGREDSFEAMVAEDIRATRGSVRMLGRRPLLVLFIGITVFWFFNNMYGSAILLYQPVLIGQLLNPGTFTALFFTAGTTTVAVIIGFIASFYLIDNLGRRFIAIGGTSIVVVAAVTIWLAADTPLIVLIAFGAAIGFINGGTSLAFYAWVPELFPTSIRGRAIGIVNMIGKLGSVVGTFTLPFAFAAFGSGAFLIIAAAALINVICIVFFTIETKNRTLAEIQTIALERFGSADPEHVLVR